jgi:hypothetical protein
MPQLQLPIFPEGVTQITDLLAFKKENGEVGISMAFCRSSPMVSRTCARFA